MDRRGFFGTVLGALVAGFGGWRPPGTYAVGEVFTVAGTNTVNPPLGLTFHPKAFEWTMEGLTIPLNPSIVPNAQPANEVLFLSGGDAFLYRGHHPGDTIRLSEGLNPERWG